MFAPRSNGREELIGSEKEVDILISTDVLSEGQNLQDCGILVNYDLTLESDAHGAACRPH